MASSNNSGGSSSMHPASSSSLSSSLSEKAPRYPGRDRDDYDDDDDDNGDQLADVVGAADVDVASLLFVGVYGHVAALSKDSGKLVWHSTLKGTLYQPTIVLPHPPSHSLLVAVGANLRRLSAATGATDWENKLTGIGIGYSSLAQVPPRTTAYDPATPQSPSEPSPPASPASQAPSMTASLSSSPQPPPPPLPPSPSEKASPAVLKGIVFVAARFVVRAIRLSDGADLWEFATPIHSGASTLPSLLIEDGVLYVAGNGRVYALDPLKGQQIWFSDIRHRFYCTLATMRSSPLYRPQRFDPSSTTPYEVAKSPLQEAVFFNSLGYVTPTDANTGSPIDADIVLKGVGFTAGAIIPLPSSNSAIVASGVNLRRVSLTDGSLMWENTLKKMGLGVVSVLVGAGLPPPSAAVDAGAGGDDLPPYDNGVAPAAAAAAAGPSTGTSSSSSTAAAASGFSDVVFVSVRGKIHAVRVSNGETVWRYDPGLMKRMNVPPRLLATPDGLLFLGGDGKLECIDATTGEKVWFRARCFPRRQTSETLFPPGLPTLN
ncbi:hypothetical protein DFJ73DRAFT_759532 [Zopfochytrium polystomum]|nr:hypothetical protein DFJ73DRAFT_759532 [Zopfochytrium polystomum]